MTKGNSPCLFEPVPSQREWLLERDCPDRFEYPNSEPSEVGLRDQRRVAFRDQLEGWARQQAYAEELMAEPELLDEELLDIDPELVMPMTPYERDHLVDEVFIEDAHYRHFHAEDEPVAEASPTEAAATDAGSPPEREPAEGSSSEAPAA